MVQRGSCPHSGKNSVIMAAVLTYPIHCFGVLLFVSRQSIEMQAIIHTERHLMFLSRTGEKKIFKHDM